MILSLWKNHVSFCILPVYAWVGCKGLSCVCFFLFNDILFLPIKKKVVCGKPLGSNGMISS